MVIILFLNLSFTPMRGSESISNRENSGPEFRQARMNGEAASESFRRCDRYVNGWLGIADTQSGLIPRNTRDRFWNAKDSAADNYPFMVLTASFTNRELFENRLHEMLETEIRLTSRVGCLPDTYDFASQDFLSTAPDLESIIFGSSEYVKDGLLPLTEWLGQSPWADRMISILDEIWMQASIETPFGKLASEDVEVNGEMLQVLSRVFWMTGNEKYLEWAIRLGDYYLLSTHHPTSHFSKLRLRDHGCEIVSGLCELYATVNYARPEKREVYRDPVHQMLDRILEVGRNDDGLFYNVIDPVRGVPMDDRLADTWGYTLNGIYTVYLIDGKRSYLDATRKALSSIVKYSNYDWEGESSDGYADSIESAINLYNREASEELGSWIDSEMRVMWSKQQPDGLIEGWHGDGNFARTSIMYALWKTAGSSARPWREDLILGAVRKEDRLYLLLSAEKEWNGRLYFDLPRHRLFMKLPIDWPRINQFPEWFTVDPEELYLLDTGSGEALGPFSGKHLSEGVDLKVQPGEILRIILTKAE